MIIGKIRKNGNSATITIPYEEMERQNLQIGDTIAFEVRKVTMKPEMPPDVRAAFEYAMKAHSADVDYLADR
jgi:antitoxin component of MazEF toxin-antitoxin module